MTDDYAAYEQECERIRESNGELLDQFEQWLLGQGLSARTVHQHTENIDLYINQFLLYEDTTKPEDGAGEVGTFLGYWFIRKAGWASKASIKSNATSLKKFYAFLHERGVVSAETVQWLEEQIKTEMPEWLATMERYVDPEIDDMDEVWGL